MAAAISNVVQAAITESRYQSSIGKFDDALNSLAKVRSDEPCHGSEHALQAEISRIHLILGDHKLPPLSTHATGSPEQGSDPYQELRFIQSELNRVSTSLELAGPLQSAASLFQKYRPLLDSERRNECIVSLLLDVFRKDDIQLTSRAPHFILLPGDPLFLAAVWRRISEPTNRLRSTILAGTSSSTNQSTPLFRSPRAS